MSATIERHSTSSLSTLTPVISIPSSTCYNFPDRCISILVSTIPTWAIIILLRTSPYNDTRSRTAVATPYSPPSNRTNPPIHSAASFPVIRRRFPIVLPLGEGTAGAIDRTHELRAFRYPSNPPSPGATRTRGLRFAGRDVRNTATTA